MKLVAVSRSSFRIAIIDINGRVIYKKTPFNCKVGSVVEDKNKNGFLILSNMGLKHIPISDIFDEKKEIDIKHRIHGIYINNHQMKYNDDGELIYVSTNKNSLMKIENKENVYTPSWLNESSENDAIHLNGFHPFNDNNVVTSFSRESGWRENFNDGRMWFTGNEDNFVKVKVPHSPFISNGKVFVLESATGSLISYDMNLENKRVIKKGIKGFVRGLYVQNNYAYVASSPIKVKSSFIKSIGDNYLDSDVGSIYRVNIFTGHSRKICDVDLNDISDLCIIDHK